MHLEFFMKKIYFLSSFFIFLLSCQPLKNLTIFDIDYKTETTIKKSLSIIPFSIATPNVKTDSESTFKNKNTSKDLIDKINVKKMVLEIKSPDNSDFSFLKDIMLSIAAENLDDLEIAWKKDINDNVGSVIDLEVTDKDIKEYIKKDSYKIKVSATTDKTIAEDHVISVNSTFTVDAKVLGL